MDVDVIESKGGVEFSSGWLAGWRRPSLPLCLSSSLLLPPRSLLLAETGLDQASNMAHARMDEAKLCRDCLSDEHIAMILGEFLTDLSFRLLRLHTSHSMYLP